MDLLAPKAAEKNLDLACIVDDAIPKILVSDVTRLRQILVNLIGNAVKFTHQGEVVIEVTPAGRAQRNIPFGHEQDTEFLRHPDQWLLHFSVRDTGIGIPLDRQSRLFKSFQQVDASTTRHYGGTGLGLAISKRLAELLGGKIWVESDAGKGATFHFTISARAAATTAPPAWQAPQPQLAGKRLLVIEDNATNRRIITHRGEQWGMTVEAVANSPDALARLAQGDLFDAVIVDWQLPDKDGLALDRGDSQAAFRALRSPARACLTPTGRGARATAADQRLCVCPQAHPPGAVARSPVPRDERPGPAREEGAGRADPRPRSCPPAALAPAAGRRQSDQPEGRPERPAEAGLSR